MEYVYNAFASYATKPDYNVVRDIEVFLESLHKNRLIDLEYRKHLELCVDGSDFTLPRAKKYSNVKDYEAVVEDLIIVHMKRCEYFLLFIGPDTREHHWLKFELSWWLENRGVETILLAVTHGSDPVKDRSDFFPDSIISNNIDKRIFFDLRGYDKVERRKSKSVRKYTDERVRLAASLMGELVKPSDVLKGWKVAEARQKKQRIVRNIAAAIISVVLFSIAGISFQRYLEQKKVSQKQEEVARQRKKELIVNNLNILAENSPSDFALLLSKKASQLSPMNASTQRSTFNNWKNNQNLVGYLSGHKNQVIAAYYLDDNKTMVSVGQKGDVIFWDLLEKTKDLQTEFPGTITAVSFHQNSGILALGFYNGELILFDTANKESVVGMEFDIGDRPVTIIDFNEGGTKLLLKDTSNKASVYELSKPPTKILDINNLKKSCLDIKFDQTSEACVLVNSDGSVEKITFADPKKSVQLLPAQFSLIKTYLRDAWLSPDLQTVVGESWGGYVFFWRFTEKGEVNHGLLGRGQTGIISAAYNETGDRLVLGGKDGTLTYLEPHALHHQTVRGHSGFVMDVTMTNDGKMVAATDDSGRISLWRFDQQKEQKRLLRSASSQNTDVKLISMAISPVTGQIAMSKDRGKIVFFDIKTRKEKDVPIDNDGNTISQMAYNDDGSLLAIVSNMKILLLDPVTGNISKRIPIDGKMLGKFTEKPLTFDGGSITVGTMGGLIVRWEPPNWDKPKLLAKKKELGVNINSFSVNDKNIWAFGDYSNQVFVGQLNERKDKLDMPRESGLTSCLSFSPDGSMLAMGSKQGWVSFWNFAAKKLIGHLPGPPFSASEILSLEYSPDGHLIYVGAADGSIWSLPAHPNSWLGDICSKVQRDLSEDERLILEGLSPEDVCPELRQH